MANNFIVKGGLVATNISSSSITGSLLGTASFAVSAVTASHALTASYVATASYSILAATASYINNLNQNLTITGSLTTTGDVIVQGDIIAKNYIISSSVSHFTESFSSGSTRFGDSSDDTHQFTGSILAANGIDVSGSARFFQDVQVTGSINVVGAITASVLTVPSISAETFVAKLPSVTVASGNVLIEVFTFSNTVYEGATVDLLIKSTAGDMRLSTIMMVVDGSGAIKFNETSTEDIGNTIDLILTCDVDSGIARILATNNSMNDYEVRPFPRLIPKI